MKNRLNTVTILILLLFVSFCISSQNSTYSNPGTFEDRPIWAGFYANTTTKQVLDTYKFLFIKGIADRISWSDTEPNDSVYNWSVLDNQLALAVSKGYYYYFVSWSGPDCPVWIYSKGVRKVYTDYTASPVYPYYLDPVYIRYYHRYIDKLAEHIASLPEALRKVISFIQPGFGSTGDQQLYKGNLLNPTLDGISEQQYFDFFSGCATKFYQAFNKPELADIKFLFNIEDDNSSSTSGTLTGQQLYANWLRANYTIQLRKQQFTVSIGYQLNGELSQDTVQRPSFYGLTGKAPDFVRGEFSKYASGGIFQENPVWNYYWTALSTVDRGLDMWEMDYTTVSTGLYNEGFEFANKYSFYKRAQTSPYAFIALRDVLDAADKTRFTNALYGSKIDSTRFRKIQQKFAVYGAKIGDMSGATTLNNAVYALNAKAMNDVGTSLIARNYSRFITQMDANTTSVGWWRVGPTNQPYGRYARGFENATNKNRMYFDLDDSFFSNSTFGKSVDIKIIYLDEGVGKFSFRYDSETNHDSIAQIIVKSDTKKWVQTIIHIDNGSFSNQGYKYSDFSLVNEDSENDLFHMIELTKSSPAAGSLKVKKNYQTVIFNQTNSVLGWSENSNFDAIKIYNSTGIQIQVNKNLTSNNVSLNNLKSGVYFYRVFKNNKSICSDKFIKL